MGKLKDVLDATSGIRMDAEQREAQRQSFAYGNTKFENDHITRDTVERASRELKIAEGKATVTE